MAVSKLQTIFDELRKIPIDLRKYGGELQDAAFEIVSADTFVAGITAPRANHTSQNAYYVNPR